MIRATKAFTLIELLIVVAIIAILAAIAVPNFLEAQTRGKVARVVSELRAIDLAMESYCIDHGSYPLSGNVSWLPGYVFDATDFRLLTTPIAYITKVPLDIFRVKAGVPSTNYDIYGVNRGSGPITYARYPHDSWMTYSYGPDLTWQTGGYRSLGKVIENEKLIPLTNVYDGIRYDPTNGPVSKGDIYRFGNNNQETF